jgi:hypothetical protein
MMHAKTLADLLTGFAVLLRTLSHLVGAAEE